MADLPPHALTWFEIPVHDIERARAFYGHLFQTDFEADEPAEGYPMAFFPVAKGGVGGALVEGDGYSPSGQGSLIYLTTRDIDGVLSRVEAAGGEVDRPVFDTPWGRMAYIVDCEGNRVALNELVDGQ